MSDPDISYQVSSQLAFWVKENTFEIDCQDGSWGVHFGIAIKKILAIFNLQVTLISPTKLRINWSFGKKNGFSTWKVGVARTLYAREPIRRLVALDFRVSV